MINLYRGDIVLVYYPLISHGLSERKLRPALVVQCNRNNHRLKDVILLPLTSKTEKKLKKTHVFIAVDTHEGRKAGIRINSVIKAETILTIPKDFVYKKIGHLSDNLIKKVDQCLIISLALTKQSPHSLPSFLAQ